MTDVHGVDRVREAGVDALECAPAGDDITHVNGEGVVGEAGLSLALDRQRRPLVEAGDGAGARRADGDAVAVGAGEATDDGHRVARQRVQWLHLRQLAQGPSCEGVHACSLKALGPSLDRARMRKLKSPESWRASPSSSPTAHTSSPCAATQQLLCCRPAVGPTVAPFGEVGALFTQTFATKINARARYNVLK